MSFETLLPVFLIGVAAYMLLLILLRRGLISTLSKFHILAVRRGKLHHAVALKRIKRWNRAYSLKKSFNVRYAASLSSPLRVIPWDASGTLSETEEGFHFEGSSPLGKRVELDINPDEATVNYQQGKLWWDGGLSWCVIESKGEKHYFTSEVPDSEKATQSMDGGFGTTDIYQHLTNRYIKLN